MVTANHYFGDVIAGLLLLAVAYGLARVLTGWVERRMTAAHPAVEPVPAPEHRAEACR